MIVACQSWMCILSSTAVAPCLHPLKPRRTGAPIKTLGKANSYQYELSVQLGPPGEISTEPENWTLNNRQGSSNANLSRITLRSKTAGFGNVRVAPNRESLAKTEIVEGTEASQKKMTLMVILLRNGLNHSVRKISLSPLLVER